MNFGNFFAELKRRNVYKVAVAYAVVGWLLIQVATQVFPFFEIPNWAVRLVVLATIAGFPIALIIAWAFELTPEGIKRTEDVDPGAQTRTKPRVWIYVVVVGAVISIGLFFLGRYSSGNNAVSRSASEELRRDKQTEAATASSIPQKSIAVLPFENLSDDKGAAYFADGIQDEILTKLASIADLKVISRTSTAKYKSKPPTKCASTCSSSIRAPMPISGRKRTTAISKMSLPLKAKWRRKSPIRCRRSFRRPKPTRSRPRRQKMPRPTISS